MILLQNIMKNKLKKIILPFYLKVYKVYTLYICPYSYKKERYLDSFVTNYEKLTDIRLENAKEVIYIFWTGNNEITENRKKGIQSLKDKSGLEVQLVTPDNLSDFVLEQFPLHPAYEYLSLIQRSDYLRCYFMLHHGGGYADIKPCLNSWISLFNKLNSSDKWCIGVREKFVGGVPDLKGNIGADCNKYHNILIGNSGSYVYKPNSPIAQEWMNELLARLDFYLPKLKDNPGDAFGSGNYPIPWAYLAGHIMTPLVLKYHEKVICVDINLYSLENYR